MKTGSMKLIPAGLAVFLALSLVPGTNAHAMEPGLLSPKISSDLEVIHEGAGGGTVAINGDPTHEYDIIIRITDGSVPGDLTVQVSMDAGLTWSEEKEITLAGRLPLTPVQGRTGEKSGLTALFYVEGEEAGDVFLPGDTFSAYAPDPSTEVKIRHKGDGTAELSVRALTKEGRVFHLLEDGGYAIVVEVLKDGSYGEAVMRISADGGKEFTGEYYVPESGRIALPEVGVELVFTGTPGDSLFLAGDTYTVTAERTDYTKLVLLVSLVILLVCAACYLAFDAYMKKQIPGRSVYRIEPYVPLSEDPAEEAIR